MLQIPQDALQHQWKQIPVNRQNTFKLGCWQERKRKIRKRERYLPLWSMHQLEKQQMLPLQQAIANRFRIAYDLHQIHCRWVTVSIFINKHMPPQASLESRPSYFYHRKCIVNLIEVTLVHEYFSLRIICKWPGRREGWMGTLKQPQQRPQRQTSNQQFG